MIQTPELLAKTNIAIFKFFNQTFGQPFFSKIIILINWMFNSDSFIYFFLLFSLVIFALLFLKRKNQPEFQKFFLVSISSFVTLFIADAIGLPIVLLFKYYTQVTRPFCNEHHSFAITQIINELSCHESFPSGHMSMATVLIVSFWQLFNKPLKLASAMLLLLVAISRMATGAHYPMDIMGAIIIVLPLTLYIQNKAFSFIAKLEEKKQFSEKIRTILC